MSSEESAPASALETGDARGPADNQENTELMNSKETGDEISKEDGERTAAEGEDAVVDLDPDAPFEMQPLVDAKKAKELKKKLEKEAKMKKFQEKQEKLAAQKKEKGSSNADGKTPKAAKSEKSKPNKGDQLEAALESLKTVERGSKKPIDLKLPDAYEPKFVEMTWYDWWVKEGFFKPEYGLKKDQTMEEAIAERGRFVMVIPPPNVTGTLHLGHALMCALEDTLTRWHRMTGKVTLWVPGCDHAGIATQMVVEKTLARKEGKTRHDLGREEFVKRVWEWKNQKGDRIYEQLKRMGISADWDRVAFTMDDKLVKAVNRAFVTLFDWGFIYRSDRLVNWSCTLKSCISDIEVDKLEVAGRTLLSVPGYKDKVEFGVLTKFAYKIDEDTEIVVATTRPETMLGDVAIAVHPEDSRYTHLVGKTAKHPFVDRDLKIIADSFVEKEFGTGAVKITPAHDLNDYECGKRNNLEFITCIDEDGMMTSNCGKFSGMKRFDARVAVVEALKELGLYRDSVDNPMVVPMCSRSKDIVEPLLKLQWYLNCTEMASQAISSVDDGRLCILPEMYRKIWMKWMVGIRDWCISRQLWWGHRIPAYKVTFDGSTETDLWVAAESEEEAANKAKLKWPDAKGVKLERDDDVLDTWFSSGLFPFSVMGWPDETEDMRHFYPTDLLETGYDIIFFWVSRMIFMASTLTQSVPFKEVFLHSLVRDSHGRKMSKSLGNIIDPLDVIQGIALEELHKQLESGNLDPKEIAKAKQGQKQDYPNGIPECGTDALRFALCACMTHGRDINLDVLRCQGYRFFCNKVWNAVKFASFYLGLGDYSPSDKNPTQTLCAEDFDRMDRWILNKLCKASSACNESLEKYHFQEATTGVYNFWLYELCDVYLESLKPKFADTKPESILSVSQRRSLDVLLICVENGLKLLSPFMPFLTEELWQRLPTFASESKTRPKSICVASYPQRDTFQKYESEILEKEVTFMNSLIRAIRSTRSTYEIPQKTKTEAFVVNTDATMKAVLEEEVSTICFLSCSKTLQLITSKDDCPPGCAAAVVNDKCTVYILLKGLIDFSKEEERINKQVAFKNQLLAKLQETMSKADYSVKVPQSVQDENTNKLTTLTGEVEQLTKALESVKIMMSEN